MIRARIEAVLDAIEADELGTNAFITVDRSGALAGADAADDRRVRGRSLGPLDGQPVAVKDSLDTAGLRTTYGSGMYDSRVPGVDAVAVQRLQAAGAIVVGKTNLTEFACGTVGVNQWFGDVHNPHRHGFYPGGSSSGSAAAVAAGMVSLALGTDTAGSIRHPAAVCGVVGLKPTLGRVPVDGNALIARNLDHVGPIASSTDGAALVLEAIQDDRWGAVDLDLPDRPLRVGVLAGEFVDACPSDVQAPFMAGVDLLRSEGHEVGEVYLDIDLEEAEDHGAVLCMDMLEVHGHDIRSAPLDTIGPELLDWVNLFDSFDGDQYEDALKYQRSAVGIAEDVLARWDVVVCPATRMPSGPLDTEEDRWLRVGNLAIWALTGQPSLTVPWGAAANGMPLGLLINGRRGTDSVVLAVGQLVERLR
ncbi:MAG: amidase [Actinomycetia bacterium]|nr:amidase [Actinomycetes bacterium]